MTRPRLVLLRPPPEDPWADAAFSGFVDLYERTFTRADLREDPEAWPTRLSADPDTAEPRTFLLAALREPGSESGSRDGPLGGIVFEYHPVSRTGLLSYLVVAPPARRTGIGRRLVTRAVEILREAAARDDAELRAVFAETEAPDPGAGGEERALTEARLAALDSYGLRWIDIPYVQPSLSPGQPPVDRLLLLVLSTRRGDELAMDASVVLEFIGELYRRLDHLPRHEEDLRRIKDRLAAMGKEHGDGRVRYRQLPAFERPVFRFRDAAVTLHFATFESEGGRGDDARPPVDGVGWSESGHPGYDCPYFHSYEADVLGHRFQKDPPLDSTCMDEVPVPVTLHFPPRIDYLSEGRRCSLIRSRAEVPARAILTYTRFPASRIRVWHLTLRPEPGAEFDEYDVIKLLSTYRPTHEKTDLLERIRVAIRDAEPASLPSAFERLAGGTAWAASVPHGGMVEADLDEAAGSAGIDWRLAFEQLRQSGGASPAGKATEFERAFADPAIRPLIKACCGILTGIFDFDRMSLDEAIETLKPNVDSDVDGLLAVQRGTLARFRAGTGARPGAAAGDPSPGAPDEADIPRLTIGISPYRLIPHAALVHNEVLTDWAEAVVDRVADTDRLPKLSESLRQVERITRRYRVPNVFHYESERALFEAGQRDRGASERVAALADKVDELRSRLDELRSLRRTKGEFWLTLVLGVLGITAALEAADYFWPDDRVRLALPPNGSTALVAATAVAIAFVAWRAYPRR